VCSNGNVIAACRRAAISTVLALPFAACGELEPDVIACAAIAIAGLDVSVVDESTNQPLCDATVTATEGAYAERLGRIGCRFSGAYERPGSYSVRAERSGFITRTLAADRVVMSTGQCPHPVTVRVEIRLPPTP
jgi:hypothetical protein